MEQYAIYLRKSRADMEAEALGEGETLARHQTTLVNFARKNNLNVTAIYKEVVSGETIAARPEIQKLLENVRAGVFTGVIVMEIERLARGDSIDQGIISQTFKFSNTLIITPSKTFDPNNEYDETFFEFGLFMSRQEYKTIRRRMQAGRLASVKEGNYIGSIPPYGYQKIEIDKKHHSLVIDEAESEVVKLIYNLFLYQDMGCHKIAAKLHELGYSPRLNKAWDVTSIKNILTNPVYCGYLRWNYRKRKKSVVNGEVVVTRKPDKEGMELYEGSHEAIIEKDIWDAVQRKLENNKKPKNKSSTELKNPYAGILKCGLCGKSMRYKSYVSDKDNKKKPSRLRCLTIKCGTVSATSSEVDEAVIFALKSKLSNVEKLIEGEFSKEMIKLHEDNEKLKKQALANIEKLEKQKHKLYDLLEKEIYTEEVFSERFTILNEQIISAKKNYDELLKTKTIDFKELKDFSLVLSGLLESWDILSPADKNALLKQIVNKITYFKEEQNNKNGTTMRLEFEFCI